MECFNSPEKTLEQVGMVQSRLMKLIRQSAGCPTPNLAVALLTTSLLASRLQQSPMVSLDLL